MKLFKNRDKTLKNSGDSINDWMQNFKWYKNGISNPRRKIGNKSIFEQSLKCTDVIKTINLHIQEETKKPEGNDTEVNYKQAD